jgi:peptidoglycan hydrolase CwlO-like protein
LWKTIKIGVIGVLVVGVLGFVFFGSDLASYVRSSANQVRRAAKDNVPLEFELQRAQDMLDDIIPEMHANIRMIAQEEVELVSLKRDIAASEESVTQQCAHVRRLRDNLAIQPAGYSTTGQSDQRRRATEELSRRFASLQEAEVVLEGKKRLLETRKQSLAAAMQMLDRTRNRKVVLEDKIEALTAQHRLVQAAAAGSQFQLDGSALAKTEKLIDQIQKRLDVAERVLAHEAKFVETIPVNTPNEEELLAEVSEYLSRPTNGMAELTDGAQPLTATTDMMTME